MTSANTLQSHRILIICFPFFTSCFNVCSTDPDARLRSQSLSQRHQWIGLVWLRILNIYIKRTLITSRYIIAICKIALMQYKFLLPSNYFLSLASIRTTASLQECSVHSHFLQLKKISACFGFPVFTTIKSLNVASNGGKVS